MVSGRFNKYFKITKYFHLTNTYLNIQVKITICENKRLFKLNSTHHVIRTFKDATAQVRSCSIQEGIWSRMLFCESLLKQVTCYMLHREVP